MVLLFVSFAFPVSSVEGSHCVETDPMSVNEIVMVYDNATEEIDYNVKNTRNMHKNQNFVSTTKYWVISHPRSSSLNSTP